MTDVLRLINHFEVEKISIFSIIYIIATIYSIIISLFYFIKISLYYDV